MNIIYHPDVLQYHKLGHPESPQRISAAYKVIKKYPHYKFLTAIPTKEKQSIAVHTPEHVKSIKHNNFNNPDCPNYQQIYKYALLSAGAAIQAMKNQGFSLMRPPGHHSGPSRVAGFCYFNNIAIAVKTSTLKTLIIDFDGHHGDGTQEIFLNNPQVIYLSLHRSPWYPGTGLKTINNCHNYPLPANIGAQKYLDTFQSALKNINLQKIEQIAVSAGFDAYYQDSLASLGLQTDTFHQIGKIIKKLNKPTFSVLEGGYVVNKLGSNIHAYLTGLKS